MPIPLSSEDWLVREANFDPRDANFKETIFTIGNGYQGTRGTFEEGHKGDLSATYLAGVFDEQDSAVIDQVNVPSWLPLRVSVDGHALDVQACRFLEFSRILDMQNGTLHRNVLIEDSNGRQTRLKSVRFCSYSDQNICGIRLEVMPENYDGQIIVESMIEGERYNLDRLPAYDMMPEFDSEVRWQKWARSRHMQITANTATEDCAYLEAVTLTSDIKIGLAATLTGPSRSTFQAGLVNYESVGQRRCIDAKKGETYTFDKLVTIFTSRDVEAENVKSQCMNRLIEIESAGFEKCLQDSAAIWLSKWQASDCVISNDADATKAIRFNIYHLLIAASDKDPRVSVGAKSMSGEGYKGHVFWDTEIFLLPFYILTQPETAKALLKYRYYTLQGALENARNNGHSGAQYAWESADSGVECTPKWTPDGINRIWTGEEEIHITACVAYGVFSYVTATDDWAFMHEFGAEILYLTSRYWASRLELNKANDQYELTNVIGPDEFHEHIDNNTFTNRMAKWHLEQTVGLYDRFVRNGNGEQQDLVSRLGLTDEEVSEWRDVASKIYIPFDSDRNLIEQFSGYFALKDLEITHWDENHMPCYPEGYDHFTLNDTMLLKQPDIIMLMYLLPDEFSEAVKTANFEFYEKRTMHKSSLSPAIHSIMGIEVGETASAELYFERSAYVDLINNQGNTADGMHIASCGGTWQSLINGFGGMRVRNGQLTFKPWLPKQWSDLAFALKWQGNLIRVVIAQTECKFFLEAPDGVTENVIVFGQTIELIAEQWVVLTLDA